MSLKIMKRAFQAAGMLSLLAVFCAAPVFAQSRVHILSPATGTVVRPGQAVSVSVAADASVEKLALLAERPLPIGRVASGAAPGVVARGLGEMRPIEFMVNVPADIRPGNYHLTAMGTLPGGDTVSDAVTLDVERDAEPGRIWTEPATIQFSRVGEQIPLRVLGSFGQGVHTELTRSSKTSFVSSDPRVATVSADGLVTAVGAGKTTVTVRTATRDYSVPVRVM
jgi:Bacterial Ig-like domain (group 2)